MVRIKKRRIFSPEEEAERKEIQQRREDGSFTSKAEKQRKKQYEVTDIKFVRRRMGNPPTYEQFENLKNMDEWILKMAQKFRGRKISVQREQPYTHLRKLAYGSGKKTALIGRFPGTNNRDVPASTGVWPS